MRLFNSHIASARTLTVGLGLLATTAPVFAQTPATPAPATPVTALAPLPATDPQAKALFDKVVQRYAALKNLTFAYDGRNQVVQFSAPGIIKITGTNDKGETTFVQMFTPTEDVVMQKPNDVYEYISTATPAVPEGKTPRTRFAKTQIGGLTFSSLLGGVDPFGPDGRFKASSYTLGAPVVEDGIALTPITVTTLKAEKQPTDPTFTFFVSQPDNLVRRVETTVKLPDGTSRKLVDNFKNIKADATLAPATLAFTPPAGAVKVTEFSQPTVRAKVGEFPLALAATTKDIDGKPLSFDQFKGKVTLVDFWATWCGPCKAELPNVIANYGKYHDKGFDVVGISLDQSTDPLKKYIKEKDMTWRQVWDGYWDGPIATSYNVRAIPATILIGKDGKIAAIGARGEALEPAIQAALAAG